MNIPFRHNPPASFEGTDGNIFLVPIDGFLYIYVRYNKEWYRGLLERQEN